jgi:DnaD/phage-associated family protein
MSPKPSVDPSVELSEEPPAAAAAQAQTDSSPPPSKGYRIFQLYHETFASMVSNPILAAELKDIEDSYAYQDIQDAFHNAALANAKSYKYALAILQRWAREGRPDAPLNPPERPAAAQTTPAFAHQSAAAQAELERIRAKNRALEAARAHMRFATHGS